MLPRLLSIARTCRILLVLALVAYLLPSVSAFSDGQAASLVLGQSDFTSRITATTASGMAGPSGVVVDPTSGKVFVADNGNNRVLRFASSAALVSGAAAEGVLGQSNFTSNTFAVTTTGMFGPIGVAVDSAGHLWVADADNHRVLRFDGAAGKPNGAPADGVLGQSDFTSRITAATPSGMNYPNGVAVDSTGHLWVADTKNHRVLRFDGAAGKANGAPADGVLDEATFGSPMRYPNGVAVDSASRLWVADSLNSRVLRFDGAAGKPNGAPADGVLGQSDFTSSITPKPPTASGMDTPNGVAVDSTGRLWVADTSNNRVLRFDGAAGKANGAPADGVLGQSNFTSDTFTIPPTANGMRAPWGVGVDSTGRLWVADTHNSRVLRFDGPIVPTLTWATPAAITYGTPLSAAQLNASANVPGSFSYSPPLGTILNAGAGQTLSVLFTPTDTANYTSATTTVTIDVIQASQTITFGPLANKTLGDPTFTVSATASSGLPVSFSSSTPSVCTISGSTITLLAAGTCTITADQPGNTNYHAAPQVSQSFSVAAGQFRTYLPLLIR